MPQSIPRVVVKKECSILVYSGPSGPFPLFTVQWVAEAIDRLPTQAHKIYQLNREHGLSITEIAAQLSLSPQTVENTLTRAVSQIREYLQEKGLELLVVLILLLLK